MISLVKTVPHTLPALSGIPRQFIRSRPEALPCIRMRGGAASKSVLHNMVAAVHQGSVHIDCHQLNIGNYGVCLFIQCHFSHFPLLWSPCLPAHRPIQLSYFRGPTDHQLNRKQGLSPVPCPLPSLRHVHQRVHSQCRLPLHILPHSGQART